MASNLEKMKAKKAQNKSSETSVTASYSIDSIEIVNTIKDNNAIIDINDSPVKNSSSAKISAEKTFERSTSNSVVSKTKADMYTENSSDLSKAINDIKPIASNNNSPEKSLGLRLASEEDKRYLNLAPLSRSMTKKAFFMELIYKEIATSSKIDIYDPLVEEFRESSLKTAAITISVPESLIVSIKNLAAKHMMKYQRYVAYVVYKARTGDPLWK